MDTSREQQGVDAALSKALAAGQGKPTEACPDSNLAAAYLEKKLTPPEVAAFETHAAVCRLCQEMIAMTIRLATPQEGTAGALDVSGKRVLFHISVPLSALALLLITVGLGVVFLARLREEGPSTPKTEISQAPAPTKETVPSPPEVLSSRAADVPSHRKTPATPVAPPPASKDTMFLSQRQAPGSAAPVIAPPSSEVQEEPTARQKVAMATLAGERKELGEPSGRVEPVKRLSASALREGDALSLRAETLPGPKEALIALARRLALEKEGSPLRPAAATATAEQKGSVGGALSAETLVRRVGDRTFYRELEYWVDSRCSENPEAEFVFLAAKSSDAEKILTEIPDLAGLLALGRPVLLFWNGKNYVIR